MSSSHLLLPASGRHWWVVAVRTPLPAAHTDHGLYAPIPGDEVVFERQPAHTGKQTGSSAWRVYAWLWRRAGVGAWRSGEGER
jgi:hypothetical protein